MPTASRSSSKAKRAKVRKTAKLEARPVKTKAARAAVATGGKREGNKIASAKSTTKKFATNSARRATKAGATQTTRKGGAAVSKVAVSKVAPSKAARSKKAARSAAKVSAKKAAKVGSTKAAARGAKPPKTSPTTRPPKSKAPTAERATAARASKNERVAAKGERAARSAPSAEWRAAQQLKFGFTEERSELAVLQKQNRHLLLQIAKRRALITVSRQAAEELLRELSERVIPYREELFAITRELCDLRDRLLDGSGLPASQLEKVRWALHQMLATLPVDEAEDAEVDASETDEPRSAAGEPERPSRAESAARSTSSEERVNAPHEPTDSAAAASAPAASGPIANGAVAYEFAPRTSASNEAAHREAASAAKPTGDQSGALRTLFKKLAITYHPDRVQEEVAKAARTKIMKELTQAFEAGDLARLLELSRTLAARASSQEARETPERQKQVLTQSNQELRAQLTELKVELDRLKEDCPFTLDLRLRDPARLARDELDQLVLDRHLEVERAAKTREFVASFAAGRMKVGDFIQGPPHLRRFNQAQLAHLMR